MSAGDTGILHYGVEKSLPCATPTYHKIHCPGIEQHGSHQPGVYIGKLGLLPTLFHAGIDHFMWQTVQCRQYVSVPIGRTGLIYHGYAHLIFTSHLFPVYHR